MKKLLFLIFTLISMGTFAESRAGVGVTSIFTTPLYKYEKNVVFILPVFDAEYKDLYIKNLEIGYTFYRNEAIKTSLFINPIFGYDIDGKDLKDGYKDIRSKNFQIALGANFEYNFKYDFKTVLSFEVSEKGNEGKIRFERDFYLGERFQITPSIFMRGYSEKYVNYYFGVESIEASRNSMIASSYQTNNIAYSYGATLSLEYSLTEHVAIGGFVGVESYSKDISNSPLIENKTIYFGGVGIKYYF